MSKFYYGTDSENWLQIAQNGRLEANTLVTPFKEVAQNFGSVILEIEAAEYVKDKYYFKIGETSLRNIAICDIEED